MTTNTTALEKFELFGPLALGGVFGVGAGGWFWCHALPGGTDSMLGAAVGLAAIAMGFLATAQSIIVSMSGRKTIRQLKQLDLYDQLLDYFDSALRAAACLAVWSLSGLLFGCEAGERWPIFAGVWVAASVWTAAYTYRVLHLLGKILRRE